MTSQRSLPPPDFAQRSLPTESVPAGASWVRIHGAGKGPLWFGPAPGGPPSGRFDDPQGEYRLCYLGLSLEAAFAEVFLRDVPVRLLPRQALHERALSRVVARESVRLVRFHGAGLAQLGATAEVAYGSHDLSRPWGRVCWEHPDKPDGLLYRARHDDDQ
ncbi:MAG: RES family NAD+ phosphorylase, partial [Gemmatimonadales bacterium]